MNYRLLILGIYRTSPQDCVNCFELMTAKVAEHFRKLPHVTVDQGDRKADLAMIDGTHDFVLFIGYTIEGVAVRERTPKGKMLSLLECPYQEADWSFCFGYKQNKAEQITEIPAPVPKDMLVNLPKEKQIIIDHWWRPLASFQKCWTLDISDWLSCLKDEYKIFRMTRFIENDDEAKTVKPHEFGLPHTNYLAYLDATARVETFICTHTESYGYGILDMAARGIRVVTPPGFICVELADRFELPVFNNREELLDLVRRPVEPRWNEMVNRCTDYSEVVRIIDAKCQELLG